MPSRGRHGKMNSLGSGPDKTKGQRLNRLGGGPWTEDGMYLRCPRPLRAGPKFY